MEMNEHVKLVEFMEWCHKCKHVDKAEIEEPCDECISVAAREFSHKPLKFEAKEEK